MAADSARRGPMRRAVDRSAPPRARAPEDRGTYALAAYYADLIDEAAGVARIAAALFDPETGLPLDDMAGRQQLAALAKIVEPYRVADALGPKLLAALQQLHLTTAARARARTGGPADDADPAEQALTRIRAARPGARVDDPPPVDAPPA